MSCCLFSKIRCHICCWKKLQTFNNSWILYWIHLSSEFGFIIILQVWLPPKNEFFVFRFFSIFRFSPKNGGRKTKNREKLERTRFLGILILIEVFLYTMWSQINTFQVGMHMVNWKYLHNSILVMLPSTCSLGARSMLGVFSLLDARVLCQEQCSCSLGARGWCSGVLGEHLESMGNLL